MPEDLLVTDLASPPSESPAQDSPADSGSYGEQHLDEHLDAEREEIAELDEANAEEDEPSPEDAEEVEGDEEADDGEYRPNTKYKVNDDELEFDPKLKPLLTKETEPIIRELYEKAHGIEVIKKSRDERTRERDEVRGNYDNLVGEVGRVLTYKKAGDLEAFFEAVQLTDDQIAKYILEKARISQLPPEQQAVYNDREALRRRMNLVEQNLQRVQATGTTQAVQARTAELDQVLSQGNTSRLVKDYDTRNGVGSFKTRVIAHAAQQYELTKQDLTPSEAVESYIKFHGIRVPKGQPKPGADATRRVVARPKVKTIPNYGGGQASVTATKKPRSVDDLRKLAREFNS